MKLKTTEETLHLLSEAHANIRSKASDLVHRLHHAEHEAKRLRTELDETKALEKKIHVHITEILLASR